MSQTAEVGVLMGSKNDWPKMQPAVETLESFGIAVEARVLSAHRTPAAAAEYASSAIDRGMRVIIAGAGGSAHLAGVIAAHTVIPVLGVPISSSALSGMDALLATVQMPKGIPVGTLAVDGSANAALLAVAILATDRPELQKKLLAYRAEMAEKIANTPPLSEGA